MINDSLFGALAGLAFSLAAASVSAATTSFDLSGGFGGEPASGSISFDTGDLVDDICEDGDFCLTLSDLSAFSLSFDDPGFSALDPFGLADLIGDPDQIVLELDAPFSLTLDIRFGTNDAGQPLMLSLLATFENGAFIFDGSVDLADAGGGSGGGNGGLTGNDGAVVPLPGGLALLLGGLGFALATLRRKAPAVS